jgi:hypothetical protein
MPHLLIDLAEETSASNQRTVERLATELQELMRARDQWPEPSDRTPELLQRVTDTASQVEDYVLSQVPQVEAIWSGTLRILRHGPPVGGPEPLLTSALQVFESAYDLFKYAHEMWDLVATIGAATNQRDELNLANRRVEQLITEVRKSLEFRRSGWKPSDPERFAAGQQLAREGKTVKAEEARNWFRPSSD